ncbi:MAG: U32 family peptidase, partial [Acidobacteriota bacterium]
YAGGRRVDTRLFPSRQISLIADVDAYAEAGADVLKLQGRSLPVELLAPLVRRYRTAIDTRTGAGSFEPPPATLPAAWAVVGR